MKYLMESANEAERLLNKSDEETSKAQLELTGLTRGMKALDAGGGAGFVTKIMGEIVGPKGSATIADQSSERLLAAKEYCKGLKNVSFVETDLEKLKLEDSSMDYVFSRFVFEYLKRPQKALKELIRVTKRGGKIVVGDLDYNCMSHYPLAPHLEKNLFELIGELQRLQLWDPYMGRKIYSMFFEADLSDIKVHFLPHHLIYGEANPRDNDNWAAKLEQMQRLQKAGTLKLSFDVDSFRSEFFSFFQNPARFSYSPLILVEGIKR